MKKENSQYDAMDKTLHAAMSKLTSGLSPSALMAAYADWAVHLALSPGKQAHLMEKATRKSTRLAGYLSECTTQKGQNQPCIEPLPFDKRFSDPTWQTWPFNLLSQSFLLNQQWWSNATTDVNGVTQQHENVVEFATRQMLDIFSPSNYLLTNPQLLEQTKQEGGQNLVRGMQNLMDDMQRHIGNKKPVGTEEYAVGKNLAVTPGKVVYRNHLIELIQYTPVTEQVRPEPILIVPAWIMKYYILDLSAQNSLVKYLTEQGFTVFMVSWKNPDQDDRDLGMADYRKYGVMDAIDTIGKITGKAKIHGIGYCLGGTLLSIAAAAMSRDGDDRIQSLSLLATQVDFSEAGELMLFINESQVSFLEDMMWEQGYLDAKQMSGAFQLLRSNDLIWSRMVHDYLMGNRTPVNDLMAWNSDTTRMPYKMHSHYLRKLFLDNDLTEGRYLVDDKPISISDIRAPAFVVGTQKDHVAPWQSVYKFHLLSDTDVTFLLTSGGHNAGIVSEPGHPRRSYQIATTKKEAKYTDPNSWEAKQAHHEGSWWPELTKWLHNHSSKLTAPPTMGAPNKKLSVLCDAPGTYIFQN
ncbi:alpha/beta hydrolase [Colwellia sp. MB02u-9]|uniref:PHA/PHB synthase family protein n=1 Tax=Colwellia sp. MB02u-9 TaxID=2759823 RepID=UPI0015F55F46|nr:alpha/beta fold hydrolase [Colwellia sp. MB02u-9]MBA6296139.1 alpha/beta fold hydrolase [Colwellia sp. MB02u-9]